MSEPRKASDILLSLEEKIDTLTKVVKVYDLNTKLILDRVNKMYAYIQTLQNEMAQEQAQLSTSTPDDQAIVQTSTDHIITMTESPVGHRRTARSESYAAEVPAVPVTVVQPPRQAKNDSNDKKIPVIQRVTDHSGKDLFMAEVSVFNEQKELVVKTKTSAAGKWQAYLKPGPYSVNIIKTDTATQKKIEALQNIIINDSSTTVTLPIAVIKR